MDTLQQKGFCSEVSRDKETTVLKNIEHGFAADVLAGLGAKQKYLPSKYLYNKRGDEIFQEIMAMPEYYLTRSEYEIFSSCKEEMLEKFRQGTERFQLIEFGAGDGMKTKVLLRHFVAQNVDFNYIPIDISANILDKLVNDLKEKIPELKVNGICDDYFKAIGQLNDARHGDARHNDARHNDARHNGVRKVVLFLGANIGNFNREENIAFLCEIANRLSPGDLLLIGFDLQKDPAMILDAYFDKGGVTRAFKLNLLDRINEELGADFDTGSFQYFPVYDPMEGSIRSYLVSKKDQDVHIRTLDKVFHFDAWEAIYMERSQKFSLQNIEDLAGIAGFKVVHNFFDCKHYFTDSLWELQG